MFRPNSTKMAIPFLILLMLGLSLIQCDGGGSLIADYVYTIKGTVSDSITGTPLDSATVYYATGSPAFTDTIGQYRFEREGSMPSPLSCSIAGYVTKERTINRVEGVYEYDSINFQLVPVP